MLNVYILIEKTKAGKEIRYVFATKKLALKFWTEIDTKNELLIETWELQV